MLGRSGIQVPEQAGEYVQLLLLAARPTSGRDLGQPPVYLDHRRRVGVRGRRQTLRGDAQVAGLAVKLGDLFLGSCVGDPDRGHEQPFAETDLNRLEERREPALDQIRDRLELVRNRGPVHLGQDADQLVPALGSLHLVQARGQLGELHDWSRGVIQ